MKIEFFSSVQELKKETKDSTVSKRDINARKKFVRDIKKARERNINSESSISL